MCSNFHVPIPYAGDSAFVCGPVRVLMENGTWRVSERERPEDWRERCEPKPIPALKPTRDWAMERHKASQITRAPHKPGAGRPAKSTRAHEARPKGRRRILFVTAGQQFGKWTVLKEISPHNGERMILCACACGNHQDVRLVNLISGISRSCGNACREHKKRHDEEIKALYLAGLSRNAISRQLKLDKKTVSRRVAAIGVELDALIAAGVMTPRARMEAR